MFLNSTIIKMKYWWNSIDLISYNKLSLSSILYSTYCGHKRGFSLSKTSGKWKLLLNLIYTVDFGLLIMDNYGRGKSGGGDQNKQRIESII